MLIELIAFLGAAGIAITVFAIIVALSDRPLKAFITVLMLLYPLFFLYIYILKEVAKRKEEKRATGPQEGQHYK
jgi:Ca2+/Na+ antiporter